MRSGFMTLSTNPEGIFANAVHGGRSVFQRHNVSKKFSAMRNYIFSIEISTTLYSDWRGPVEVVTRAKFTGMLIWRGIGRLCNSHPLRKNLAPCTKTDCGPFAACPGNVPDQIT